MTQLRDRMLEELERRNYSPGAKPGFSDGDFRASHSARCSASSPRSSEWFVGKPHLTLQRLTPTTSCGPETLEPSKLPKTRLSRSIELTSFHGDKGMVSKKGNPM